MKYRIAVYVPICLASLLWLTVATNRAQAPNGAAKLNQQVDQVFAQFDKPTSPGCALAVIKDGQIVYQRGYGMANLDHDIPIKPDTVFHVASVSKQFTAMAILLLAKQGKLSLDDEVQKYITELRRFDVPITIRHLLHHTSGLRDQWELLIMSGWRLSEDVVRDDDVLDLVSRMKALNFAPGERYLYSNTGYTLAAQVVKRVSGQSLREFTEANIFKPLGMTRTFFRDDHLVVVKQQAYGYQTAPGSTFRLSVPNYDTVGASSLLTTVEDLARWDQNFYDQRVGGADVIAQMETPGKVNGGGPIGYGLGLAVGNYKGLRVIEHSGADAGYRSQLMRFPDQRFSVACLCNLASANPSQLARKVADIYLAAQLKPEASPAAASDFKLSEKELAAYAGPYWTASTAELGRVELREGKLYLAFDGNSAALNPLGKERFRLAGPNAEVTFTPGENGARQLALNFPGRTPITFTALALLTPTAAQLAEYAGNYYSEELDVIYKLSVKDGKLTMTRRKYGPLVPQGIAQDVFTIANAGSIRFTRDAQNRVTGLTLSRGRIKNFRFDKLPQ